MVKSISRLKVMFSSTSELEVERSLFRKVVDDVNNVIEDAYGVTLRLIDWRRDIVPGVGSDPQQVINVQTTDCQIYVGVLGARFGTPTPRAGSGTEDEFNIAYASFRADPTSMRLLFYFRVAMDGDIYSVDTEQLKRVQEFRSRLGSEKGVLYSEFASPEDFIELARGHLIQLVSTQWAGSSWKDVPGLEPASPTDILELLGNAELSPREEEEPGILDLRVDLDESFETAMSSLSKISELMASSAVKFAQWGQEAERRLSISDLNPKRAKAFVNSAARDFGDLARQLRPLIASYRAASDDYYNALGQLLSMQVKSGFSTKKEIADGVERLSKADKAARGAREMYEGIAATMASLAGPTTEFKRQRRNAVSQIEQLNAAIGAWLDRSAELRQRFSAANDDLSES